MQIKRLVYLDIFRGFMILIMIMMHPLMGLVYNSEPGALDKMSLWVLMLCTPLAIVTTWAPVFAFTSGTANAYVMYSALKKKEQEHGQLNKMFFRGLLNGLMLYLFAILSMTFLHHSMEFNGKWQHTLLTGYLVHGEEISFSPEFLFFNDTLSLLSITGILTTILLCLLWRNGGYRNHLRTYLAVCGVIVLILMTSGWLHTRYDSVFYSFLDEKRWFAAFGLKCLIGPRFSPVPFMVYALFGVIFGMGFANNASLQWFRKMGYGTGLLFLVLFAIGTVKTGFRYIELTWSTVPMKIHFLDIGLIIITATVLMELSEFSSDAFRKKFEYWTTTLRRFGRVSLSIFLSEILISVFIYKMFLYLWGADTFPRHPAAVIPFLCIILLFWTYVVKVWEKHGYKYGIEWLLIQLNEKLVGHTSRRLATLNEEKS
jgi:hypothetical protein